MGDHTLVNLKDDVEDMALKFDLSPGLESRFARKPLQLEKSGMSYYKVAPNFRTPFGHRHSEQEEIYVIVSGNARVALGDEVIEMRQWDAIRIPPDVTRAFEGGPDGAEVLAFGAPDTDNKDAEMFPGWWTD